MISIAVLEGIFGSILYPLLTNVMGTLPAMVIAAAGMVTAEGVMLLPTGIYRTLLLCRMQEKNSYGHSII
jgi:hypothetical protein